MLYSSSLCWNQSLFRQKTYLCILRNLIDGNKSKQFSWSIKYVQVSSFFSACLNNSKHTAILLTLCKNQFTLVVNERGLLLIIAYSSETIVMLHLNVVFFRKEASSQVVYSV